MIHRHPFEPILFEDTTKLIVGTLPPPRFSFEELALKAEDVEFCYGSADNQLWRILDLIYDLDLEFAPTKKAQKQRTEFLQKYKVGICDSVSSCVREKIDASDTGMQEVVLRDLLAILRSYKNVDTLLLMGGASKNSPEYFLHKLLKKEQITFKLVEENKPKLHQFLLDSRIITVVSLISPSNAANRSIGADPSYKMQKKQDPNFTTFDFRVAQYKKFFPIKN